jgi:hypothetical protein
MRFTSQAASIEADSHTYVNSSTASRSVPSGDTPMSRSAPAR